MSQTIITILLNIIQRSTTYLTINNKQKTNDLLYIFLPSIGLCDDDESISRCHNAVCQLLLEHVFAKRLERITSQIHFDTSAFRCDKNVIMIEKNIKK